MSQYADVGGWIRPINKDAQGKIVDVLESRDYFEFSLSTGDNDLTISIWQCEKFWEEEYDYLFEQTRGLVESGEIEVWMDDHTIFCYEKRSFDADWHEIYGRVVYDRGQTGELVGQIIDGVEDICGIQLRIGYDEVAINRETYMKLRIYIEDTLRNWGLVE